MASFLFILSLFPSNSLGEQPTGILKKDFVSIAKLLVLLAHEFRCPYQLPSNIEVVVVHREVCISFFSFLHLFPSFPVALLQPLHCAQQKLSTGGNSTKTTRHQITGDETAYGQIVDIVPARE